jgi:hypothetical protein
MDNLITSVYVFKQLSDDLKRANKIKVGAKIPRFDIVGENSGGYQFLEPLFNNKHQCNIILDIANRIVKADSSRIADQLIRNSRVGNLTSLYYTDVKTRKYFGNTNPNPRTSQGENPMLQYKNDLLLIEISEDEQSIIIAVCKDVKHFGKMIYTEFVNGKYDGMIEDKLQFLDTEFGYNV